MWEMAKHSVVLFFQGRLFQDYGAVFRRLAIGVLLTTVVFLLLALPGLPLWVAAAVSGFVGGLLQPYLFRDLKYS